MKKLIFFSCVLAVPAMIMAQPAKPANKPTTKPATKPAAKPAGTTPVLKTLSDSASYAIGVDMANFYKQQGFTSFNVSLFTKACNDVYADKQPLLKEGSANELMNKVMIKLQEDKAKPYIDAGKAYLAENKKRPGVKTTTSGLQYEVVTEGTGIKPTSLDTFVCHYRGTLINGTQFDASYDRGQPLIMPVSGVIRGWTEGLQLMSVGSKYKFFIPYNLAYGAFDNGAIPGGSTLLFDVELLDVKKRQ
ncbi:MAG TPA: FKBP-type peptidyl-prolyl cis-trans isomerase [Chitinophagaceae bacterium]